MNDIKSMTTEQLVRSLDIASYSWGLCDGREDEAGARRYWLDTSNARNELQSRIRQHEKDAEARVEELTTENARLEQELSTTGEDSEHRFMEMERLTEERDTLRTENDWFREQVDELTEKNARLKQEAQADGMRIAMLKQGSGTLRAENERLEQEVAEVTEDYKAAADSAGVAHGELRAHEGYIQWLEAQLAEERDGLRWQRNDLEDRLERMAEENARLKQEAQADGMRIAILKQERDELKTKDSAMADVLPDMSESRRRQVTTLQDEVARLRAENERMEQDVAEVARYFRASSDNESQLILAVDSARAELARIRTAVPRVIRPDEVREGQTVVFSNHNNDNDWIVEVVERDVLFASDYNGTIVLLADAPEDADEDDFPCCRIKQAGICEGDG